MTEYDLKERLRELHIALEQQAGWLREITQERDVLKMRVAELESRERFHCGLVDVARDKEQENEALKLRMAELEQGSR